MINFNNYYLNWMRGYLLLLLHHVPTTSIDEIYTQVIGPERHRRVRGYEFGPTPTSIFGSTSKRQSTTNLANNLNMLKKSFKLVKRG